MTQTSYAYMAYSLLSSSACGVFGCRYMCDVRYILSVTMGNAYMFSRLFVNKKKNRKKIPKTRMKKKDEKKREIYIYWKTKRISFKTHTKHPRWDSFFFMRYIIMLADEKVFPAYTVKNKAINCIDLLSTEAKLIPLRKTSKEVIWIKFLHTKIKWNY